MSGKSGTISGRAARRWQLYLMLAEARAEGFRPTADLLAESLGCSRRTVFREIEALRSAGLELEGTPHLGFSLEGQAELGPLFLTREERATLVAGASGALKAKLRAL